MISAELPLTEAFRLIDLASYDIMDTQAEDDFDELVELAGQICNCPISLITLLSKDRQWFKAKTGVTETGTSREIAFCSHAILQDDVMVVEDATKDERFIDSPLVTGDMNIRFYAGAPIISPSGYKLGTICILDDKPRKLSAPEQRALVILSNQVTKLMELRKKNILIRERAEEVIAIKTNAIGKVFQHQEEEKKEIASSLHEDMAQRVASCLFLLQTAESDNYQSTHLLKEVRNQLKETLSGMQSMSYAITPHIIDLLPAKDLVQEYAEKIASTFPFAIKVKTEGNKEAGSTDNAINSVRIIEKWLKVLAEKKDVSHVVISLVIDQQFQLIVEDNGHAVCFDSFKKKVVDSLVYERANACGGTVEWAIAVSGNNVLKVCLPITAIDQERNVA